jgi:hypothetical protein
MSDYSASQNQPMQSGAGPGPAAHHYTLAVHDHGLMTAVGLLMQSLPYALARLGVEITFAVGGIVWVIVTFGGTAWLGTHVAQAFGWVWFIGCIAGAGFLWGTVLRYLLHLIECGHVAVLTELIVYGDVANGGESMFAYGRRIVTERFGEANALFALNELVRGVLAVFHRTLDWFAQLLPIPGLDSVSSVVNLVLRAATRYLDKVILSYSLSRGDQDPWRMAREGMQYYCQNAKPILKTSVYIVILERGLSILLWIVLMAPAAAVTMLLPQGVREGGGFVTVIIAVLLAAALRNAFVKPIFLIMMMIRFHTLIENQPLNAEWARYLESLSDKFRDLGRKVGVVRA